ncbi:MAG: division/cell wall cluster transcriptional repressor MraZ [Erysipelotrichaceae bacterium]|jgi:MraZ protein|nr:division/cell wall cluster transcriptional repressor MraZ [Erysipelotrichaceae bacterium]
MFFGSYNHTLDEKGRLMIPRKMREQVGEVLYIMQGYDGSLSLYTETRYQALVEEYSRLSFNQSKVRDYLRLQFASTFEIEIDKLGRIQLPTALLSKFNISRDVMVLGIGDHIEIWDKTKYEDYENLKRNEFDAIAEEISNK